MSSVIQGVKFFDACMEGEEDISAWSKCANVLSTTTMTYHHEWSPPLNPPSLMIKCGILHSRILVSTTLSVWFLPCPFFLCAEVEGGKERAFKTVLACLLVATECVPFHSKQTTDNTAGENKCILKTLTQLPTCLVPC